jgi:hypothetical protein
VEYDFWPFYINVDVSRRSLLRVGDKDMLETITSYQRHLILAAKNSHGDDNDFFDDNGFIAILG